MQLPGRLDTTTLGDLLGTLYRGHATGVLELSEAPASTSGRPARVHRIQLLSGLVAGVETALDVPPIGEALARAGKLDRRAIDAMLYRMALGDPRPAGAILVSMGAVTADALLLALRGQLRDKVDAVYRAVEGARVAFRTSRPLPRDALRVGTLLPRDFLHGRPRTRDHRRGARPDHKPHSPPSPPPPPSAKKPWWSSSRPGYEGQAQETPPPPSGRRPSPTDRFQARDTAPPVPPPSPARAVALRTLGLFAEADEVTIRRAFRRLAMELHPDRYSTSPEEIRARHAARFAEASAAYHLLVA